MDGDVAQLFRASDRHAADAGSIAWCGKGIFFPGVNFQCKLSVLPVSVQPRVQTHAFCFVPFFGPTPSTLIVSVFLFHTVLFSHSAEFVWSHTQDDEFVCFYRTSSITLRTRCFKCPTCCLLFCPIVFVPYFVYFVLSHTSRALFGPTRRTSFFCSTLCVLSLVPCLTYQPHAAKTVFFR